MFFDCLFGKRLISLLFKDFKNFTASSSFRIYEWVFSSGIERDLRKALDPRKSDAFQHCRFEYFFLRLPYEKKRISGTRDSNLRYSEATCCLIIRNQIRENPLTWQKNRSSGFQQLLPLKWVLHICHILCIIVKFQFFKIQTLQSEIHFSFVFHERKIKRFNKSNEFSVAYSKAISRFLWKR